MIPRPNHQAGLGDCLGFTDYKVRCSINLNQLWRETIGDNREMRITNFIDNFIKVHVHEEIHRQIHHLKDELWEKREEEIVDSIADSKTLKTIRFYPKQLCLSW